MELRSGDALFAFDGDLTILSWNSAAEELHLLRNETTVETVKAPPQRTRLTPRQLEVLELIAQGWAAKAIAGKLGIAEPTVRNHIRSILLELDCHSQLEALAVARRRGLI